MENSNQFKLEVALDGYLERLQEKGNYTFDDINELKSHLLEEVIELRKKDLNDDEALAIAKMRLGKNEDLNEEYKKVNGNKFLNRDLFILLLSIATCLLFYFFYYLITGIIQQYAFFVNKNLATWGVINYLFIILFTAGILYLVFNCNKYIRLVERLFIKSPVNFSSICIALIMLIYVLNLRVGKMFYKTDLLTADQVNNRFYQFEIDHKLKTFIYWGLVCVWMVGLLLAFIKSYKKVKFLDNVINHSGYILLFLIGLFWDATAASTRMINSSTHPYLYSSFAFGIIWLIGMLILNVHLSKNVLMRNIIFISFGFMLELGAGLWINPGLKAGAPVSVYFIALVIGSALGFMIGNFIKRGKIKLAV